MSGWLYHHISLVISHRRILTMSLSIVVVSLSFAFFGIFRSLGLVFSQQTCIPTPLQTCFVVHIPLSFDWFKPLFVFSASTPILGWCYPSVCLLLQFAGDRLSVTSKSQRL
jgi:hypothetical protein